MRAHVLVAITFTLILTSCSQGQHQEAQIVQPSALEPAEKPPLPEPIIVETEIITEPLTPDTGRYAEIGTDIPMPQDPKEENEDEADAPKK